MAIEQNRIEAAARVRWQRGFARGERQIPWERLSEKAKRNVIRDEREPMEAAFPELASDPPTGWVAPWTETKTMWKAGDAECNADEEIDVVWSAMRDAHLKEQGHE